MVRLAALALLIGLTAAACGGSELATPTAEPEAPEATGEEDAGAPATAATTDPPSAKHKRDKAAQQAAATGTGSDAFGLPPAVPDGPLAPEVKEALDVIFTTGLVDGVTLDPVRTMRMSGDPRIAWLINDLLRFVQVGRLANELLDGFEELTGTELEPDERAPGASWKAVSDHLIAWDLPAPPGYIDFKRNLFTLVEPGWEPFFDDEDADIDWRWVTWGGVQIDDRELGDPDGCPRGCIPALDDPAVTDAAGGDWYPDDLIVFGVVVGDEARAYPKNMMEVHEMVNDTIGGRRIGMPYCTLCGSAQAYFTDNVGDEDLVLRTSGLLSRSNKVMYDLTSQSVFDTFTGEALSGPLQDAGVVLEPVTVVTSTWGEWKEGHPNTTIVAQDGGIGRSYPADPLGGRDDDGPIFPVGSVDQRLPIQEPVVGAIAPDGTPVAFPAAAALAAIEAGEAVELAGVRVVGDGGGLRVTTEDGEEISSHQAFWFAWSQFRPDTVVWTPLAG